MSGKNFLEMSDEEMMAAGPGDAGPTEIIDTDPPADDKEDLVVDPPATDEDDLPKDPPAEEDPKGKDDPDAGEAGKEGEDAAKVKEAPSTEVASKDGEVVDPPKDKDVPKAGVDAAAENLVVDYKAEYERLTKPFKANGKEVHVKSVDDAISLMQMGANYHKKMAAIKPHLKLMKMLEKNQLMSEDKIGFLIDLDKKNPDAIHKLLKESGVDPLEFDADKPSAYKPTSYSVDDREMALDSALEEIQDTPEYNRTLEVLGTKWDGKSKQVIAENPSLVKVINDHIASGIYDVIAGEVDRDRMLGRLEGLSDIDAYRKVGDAIQARGGFKDLMQQNQKTPNEPVIVQPKPKTAEDDKLRDKKRAAATSTPTAASKVDNDFNPLGLSDEAFAKLVDDRFK